MFDLDQMYTHQTWRTALSAGDIVLFPFPLRDGATEPRLRPCLVLEVERRGAEPRMIVAPGTSHMTRARDAYDVDVFMAKEIRAA